MTKPKKKQKALKEKVLKHFGEDIEMFEREADEDRSMIRLLKGKKMKKQSAKDRADESLGMRRGKESTKKQSYASRRKESKGMKKAMKKKGK